MDKFSFAIFHLRQTLLLFLCSCVVEIAIKNLEDDPTFDAGHGSVLNVAGQIEMDAIIMDGSKRTSCDSFTSLSDI